jgi:ankyrin repeat protein
MSDKMLFDELDHDRRLPVHYCGTSPYVAEVALLQRESLGDVDTQDGRGWIGLHFAHREDSLEMVQYIREPPAFLPTALWDVLAVALIARRDSLDIGCLMGVEANTLPKA